MTTLPKQPRRTGLPPLASARGLSPGAAIARVRSLGMLQCRGFVASAWRLLW